MAVRPVGAARDEAARAIIFERELAISVARRVVAAEVAQVPVAAQHCGAVPLARRAAGRLGLLAISAVDVDDLWQVGRRRRWRCHRDARKTRENVHALWRSPPRSRVQVLLASCQREGLPGPGLGN